MFEWNIEQLQDERADSREIRQEVVWHSVGTRRVIAGDRIIDGKRYAIEAEAVALVICQDAVDVDRHVAVAPVVLDKVREMLHKSLTAFARRGVEPISSGLSETGAEAGLDNQDYHSLIDYVIVDQRDTVLPGCPLNLVGKLQREVEQAARVRERLVFVVTGQMIEADIENACLASAG
jgi:hypothetical protein